MLSATGVAFHIPYVSTLQKHWSKTSKPIRFGSLPFRGNWGWSCTAVRMWLIHLICSNIQWWDCSSPMSALLTAEEGCETSWRIVQLWVSVA